MKILIVDPDCDIRELFGIWMQNVGFAVELAADAAAAMDICKSASIDIVICDVSIRRAEAVALLQALEASSRKIGVVLTGGFDSEGEIRVLPVMYDTFVSKPLDRLVLQERVRELAGRLS